MAFSVNKVTLLGNLGQEPDVRSTPSGQSVVNISIATSESYKDQGGNWQDKTEWHRVVLWNKLADIVSQYVRKGDKVYIEGKLQTRSWEQEGVKRYTTEISATNIILLSNRNEGGSGSAYNPAPQQAPYNDSFQEANHNPPSKQKQAPNNPAPAEQFDDDDDDVPF